MKQADRRIKLGKKGEQLVAAHLEQQGYTICALNYTRRNGEIDIIAQHNNIRIFVEVKLRKKMYFATSEVITQHKQRKIIAVARYYNSTNLSIIDMIYRFDVAIVYEENNDYTITYIPNAFTEQNE